MSKTEWWQRDRLKPSQRSCSPSHTFSFRSGKRRELLEN